MNTMNTWPNGIRRALNQAEHEAWNAQHYPGTRQICSRCDTPTDRCEKDTLIVGDSGPLCETCYSALAEEEG